MSEMSTGKISRLTSTGFVAVATGLSAPIGLRIGTDGMLYVAEEGAGRISRINPADGTRTTLAMELGNVTYLTLGSDGAAYVSSFTAFTPTGTVRRVPLTQSGAPSVWATGIDVPEGLLFDPDGSLVIAQWNLPSRLYRFPANGGSATNAATIAENFQHLYGVARARTDGYFVADLTADRVVRVRTDGTREDVLTDVAAPAGLWSTVDGALLVVEHGDANTHAATGYLLRLSGEL